MYKTPFGKSGLICICSHSPLIIRTNTGTQYFAVVSILNTYVAHDLNNLDTYTLHIAHEQDSVVVRYERTNYTCAIARVLHSMQYDTCIHCSHMYYTCFPRSCNNDVYCKR